MTKNLTNIKGLSEAKVMKIKEAASKLIPTGFVSVKPLSNAHASQLSAHDLRMSRSGSDCMRSREKINYITTGCRWKAVIISIPVFDHNSAKQVRRTLIIYWVEELRPEVLQRYFFLLIL